MRYFDKLLNFFSSSYSNNTRFHHSTLGYLKIFFERNNKLKSTFTALGNVFRNSKWSDLKVQNIKTSFIKSWSSYFISILLVLCLTLSFFGAYSGNTAISQIPFLGDVYEIVCFSWTHTEDLVKASILSAVSIWSYVKSLLFSSTHTKQGYIYEFLSLQNTTRLSSLSKPVGSLSLSRDEIKNHMPIEVMYKLVHASKSVQDLNSLTTLDLGETQSYSDNLNIIDHLSLRNVCSSNKPKLLTMSTIEYGYTATPNHTAFIQQFDTGSADINKISTYNTALAVTNLNTQDALRSAKQDRWLVRNSLLSENLILNSNAFTQSKKLLGVNFLNSDAASKNVWNSTKLHSLDSSTSTNFISNLQELFSNQPTHSNQTSQSNFTNPNLDNFNFFENSRMWLVKKYFFTNQLKNNLTQASVVPLASNTSNPIRVNTYNYTLFLNLYNQNPQNQLSYLTLSTQPLTIDNTTVSITGMYDFYINAGDSDILKSNNLSFLNKLTYSTSNKDLKYYTTLVPSDLTTQIITNLKFKK